MANTFEANLVLCTAEAIVRAARTKGLNLIDVEAYRPMAATEDGAPEDGAPETLFLGSVLVRLPEGDRRVQVMVTRTEAEVAHTTPGTSVPVWLYDRWCTAFEHLLAPPATEEPEEHVDEDARPDEVVEP